MAKDIEPVVAESQTVDEGAANLFDLLTDEDVEEFSGTESESESGDESETSQTDDESEEDDSEEEEKETEESDEEDTESEEEDAEDDEESEEDDDEEDADDPITHEVKIDGKMEKVTLEEALAGYSRTAVFTRRTQEAAEVKRQAAEETALARGERQAYGQRMEVLEHALKATMPPEPDWDKLKAENPTQYAVERADYQRREQQMKDLAAERQRTYEAAVEDQNTQRQEHIQAERTRLIDAIPEWSDPKTGEEAMKNEAVGLVEHAKRLGFTEEDLDSVTDHRAILLLRDSMELRELKEKTKKVKTEIKEKKKKVKVLKPGAAGEKKKKSSTSAERARRRLAKSGDKDDAAELIFDMIED